MVTLTTPLPEAPQRSEGRDDFSDEADGFAEALVIYQAEQNQQATDLNALALQVAASAASAVGSPATNATSTTNLSISTVQKTLTTQSGKSYVKDMWVALMHGADPTIWMSGYIVSYTGTSLVVSIQNVSGSGTFADWTIYGIQPSMAASSPRALADGSTVADPGGAARAIGFKGLPLTAAKTAAYTLAATDMGMCVPTNSTVTFPLNSAVPLSIGDLYCIYNNSGTAISVVPASGVTMRLEGTATTGARTIAAYSKAFMHKVGTDEVLVSGMGVS